MKKLHLNIIKNPQVVENEKFFSQDTRNNNNNNNNNNNVANAAGGESQKQGM